jgi:PIN domain nuclease of toxin-antitoxin system
LRVLLDTHTFLWWNGDPERLPSSVHALIASDEHEILFSAVVAWEIAIKYGKGQLELPEPPEAFVRSRVSLDNFKPLSIDINHALRVASLPSHHHDPFDRLLVAQAQVENLTIITSDRNIAQYDVETIW